MHSEKYNSIRINANNNDYSDYFFLLGYFYNF